MASDERSSYSPAEVEAKWQAEWEARGTNAFTPEQLSAAESPYFNLMMFPYPSAEGLHVGNIYAFTGADIHGRYQRLRGKNVFEPIGFDAFGIHSENFALKMGLHPMDLIPSNVANFTRQLRRIGGMYDWEHTVDTTDPAYYRWTQWIFVQLFKAGLAERKEAPVNWCPSCKTVLANEQVISGRCERCDTAVEQRRIAQWFFKISDYAERLLTNLEHIDWSDTTRKAQINWIGRSEGAELYFPVSSTWSAPAGSDEAAQLERLQAELLAAATQGMVGIEHQGAGGLPVAGVSKLTVPVFTTRPDTIFGATYMVLAPEHPLVAWVTTDEHRAEVEKYRQQVAALDLVTRQKVEKTKTGVFTGAYCLNPATSQEIPVWIADYVLMEYGTGAIMAVPGHDERDFEFAEQFDLPIRRVVAAPDQDADAPLTEAYTDNWNGRLVNSGQFDDMSVPDGKRAIIDWLAQNVQARPLINYRLHDWCISRQRYWGPPIPVVHCADCGALPVPEEDLPVVLPRVEDFKPDDTGVSPMARVEEWYRTTCPRCGAEARRETDVSDTFLDSSWYFLRYPSTDHDDIALDPELTRKWLPVDSYIGGNEHAVLHLMYARFITMALHDLGYLDFEEPFTKFRAHGHILNEGAKMSKTKGNVIVPDPIIDRYGADTFRMYLMFLGPFEEGGDYQGEGIHGPFGFLNRLWDTAVAVAESEEEEGAPDPEVERKLHQTIAQVTEQIPTLQYNTAIAALMEYLNAVRAGGRTPRRREVEPMIPMVAPFAPHLAEELWQRLGHSDGVFDSPAWPEHDPAKMVATTVEMAVQVNGKLRGTITIPAGTGEDDAVAAARQQENVVRHLDGAEIRKIIFVPDRLLNFVVG